MARPGLSSEEIIAAAISLQSAGEKVTIQAVREKLGNRGSITTISKILKDWKEGMLGKNNAAKVNEETDAQQSLEIDLPKAEVAPTHFEPSPIVEQATPTVNEVVPQAPQTNETPGHAPHQHSQERRFDKRDQRERMGFKKRYDNNQQHHHPRREHDERQASHQQDAHQHGAPAQPQVPKYTPEIYDSESLDALSDKELLVKIRRLEIYLNKEQSRREAAEKMAREAKEYAEVIKEQIGQRIADLRQAMEETINNLKAEARELKESAEADLRFYREQLDKANKKIISLLNNEEPK